MKVTCEKKSPTTQAKLKFLLNYFTNMIVKASLKKVIRTRRVKRTSYFILLAVIVLCFLLIIEFKINSKVDDNSPFKLLNDINIYALDHEDFGYFSPDSIEKLEKIKIIKDLLSRENFTKLFPDSKVETIIEIGVRNGYFAYELLRRWPHFKHYYGIDAYEQQQNYKDVANKNTTEQNIDFENALALLTNSFGKDKITLIRRYSADAVSLFKNNSICFLYVDARHDYCGVFEDLNNYYSKVKCGGIFAGHDFQYDAFPSRQDWNLCGNGSVIRGSVKRAVLEFAINNNVSQVHVTKDKYWSSWYIFKIC
jgi:hypothetical protein